MKKRFSIKIVLISVLCLIIVGAITAFAIENPNGNPVLPPQHNDHPEPLFKADKDVEGVTFKSKEEILKMINEHQQEGTNSSIKSVVMKTWAQHMSEDDPDSKDVSFQIDPDRTVWVVITDYPDGIDTAGGFYDKATLTTVFDAQTGQFLKAKVTGICNDKGLDRMFEKIKK